ncbi:MAG TPA: hypothetical protein VGH19_22490 [Verrucomicrobiae bacterium]
MPNTKRHLIIGGSLLLLGILVLFAFSYQPLPTFPLTGGGHFEVIESVRGSNLVFHMGDRQQMAFYQIFKNHVPARFKTYQYIHVALSTNSLGVLLNKPITEDDLQQRRYLNGSFSLSLITASGQEHFGLQRVVNFHSINVGTSGANRLTDEQIIFEFTDPPAAYTRLRMYQTNVFPGKVTVATNDIPFASDR